MEKDRIINHKGLVHLTLLKLKTCVHQNTYYESNKLQTRRHLATHLTTKD